ncbi:polysaccharide deacetylase family protein [Sutcliffiella deserti]|uniref:polysaccharide deacetylase family protein n=1 Tax=Sutcliffiella deserti TaxID=2875501 RepID=UPI001CBDBFD3|nr:polysaccharide deacetylase family protein [Sutcliffiella deserti]
MRSISVIILLFLIAGCNKETINFTEKAFTAYPMEKKEEKVLLKKNVEKIKRWNSIPSSIDGKLVQDLKEELYLRKERVLNQEYNQSKEFGEYVAGVKTRMKTSDKVIALTLDACGGEFGSGYDHELMNFLIANKIKANLFINARWIDAQHDKFLALADNPIFRINNHGTEHRPLSTVPRSAWGINSTSTKEEIVTEITDNQEKIGELTGKLPRFFRSGTAFYDEVAVKIAEDLGVEVVNFDVIGDGGATFSRPQVVESMLKSRAGSIIILHMNQPSSETADGVKEAIAVLLEQGYSFVHLDEYELE